MTLFNLANIFYTGAWLTYSFCNMPVMLKYVPKATTRSALKHCYRWETEQNILS